VCVRVSVCVCVRVHVCVCMRAHIVGGLLVEHHAHRAPIIHVTHTTRQTDQTTRTQAATATATNQVLFATTRPQNKNNQHTNTHIHSHNTLINAHVTIRLLNKQKNRAKLIKNGAKHKMYVIMNTDTPTATAASMHQCCVQQLVEQLSYVARNPRNNSTPHQTKKHIPRK